MRLSCSASPQHSDPPPLQCHYLNQHVIAITVPCLFQNNKKKKITSIHPTLGLSWLIMDFNIWYFTSESRGTINCHTVKPEILLLHHHLSSGSVWRAGRNCFKKRPATIWEPALVLFPMFFFLVKGGFPSTATWQLFYWDLLLMDRISNDQFACTLASCRCTLFTCACQRVLGRKS